MRLLAELELRQIADLPIDLGTGAYAAIEHTTCRRWRHRSASGRPRADIGRYDLLDWFRLNLELLETWQAPTRDIIRLEKVNLPGGERWVGQQLKQSRLDLGHGKGDRYEQSSFAHEI